MGLRDFARSLRPGNDQQLAATLNAQQRVRRSKAATRADRAGQAWETQDRQAEHRRSGRYRQGRTP